MDLRILSVYKLQKIAVRLTVKKPVENKNEDLKDNNAIIKQSSGSFKTDSFSDTSYDSSNSSQSVDLDKIDEE